MQLDPRRRRPVRRRALLAALPLVPVALSLDARLADARAEGKPMPPDARVYFIWPQDGDVVGPHFWVRMGLSGAGISPAGYAHDNTGHHHLLIDTDLPPLDEPIPADKNHLHFGGGETEALIELPPGKHTLQLLLGDEAHLPHSPPLYSKKITITVRP